MTPIFMRSPNQASRHGVKITDIVLHWMDGTLSSADGTFANSATQLSAHYGIEDNTVHQYVLDSEVAWHSGDWDENQRSIGIEHSAQPGRDASPSTIATSEALIVVLCRTHGISPDHIYPHNRFFNTQCPGTLPIASMIASVRYQLGKGSIPPIPPVVKPPVVNPPVKSGKLVVDGIFGSATIRRLQQWAGVAQDGELGPISWRAIQRKTGAGVDGIVGPDTWRHLQETVGAAVDGIPGPDTYRHLQIYLNSH